MFKANEKCHLQNWDIFTLLSIIQNDKPSPADFFHCKMQIAYKSPQGVRRHLSNRPYTYIHRNYVTSSSILDALRARKHRCEPVLWGCHNYGHKQLCHLKYADYYTVSTNFQSTFYLLSDKRSKIFRKKSKHIIQHKVLCIRLAFISKLNFKCDILNIIQSFFILHWSLAQFSPWYIQS